MFPCWAIRLKNTIKGVTNMLGRRGAQERREQRREERAVFGRRGTATRYRMRQRLVSFGDDFWIENDTGQRVFKVDGRMLRVRDTSSSRTPTVASCAESSRGYYVFGTR
jgi:hypothetical protein